MISNFTFVNHHKHLSKLSLYYAFAFLMIASIGLQPFVEVKILTGDALAVARGKFYYGALSNIGILMWCAAASICLFSFLVLKILKVQQNHFFLLSAGLLSLTLLLDDLFLLHDQVFPKYLGINEKIILAFYPIATISFLVIFRYVLFFTTPYLSLLSSFAFLGMSVVTDVLTTNTENIHFLIEDGFKFLGITGWLYFFTSVSITTLKTSFIQQGRSVKQPEKIPVLTIIPEKLRVQTKLARDKI